MGRQLSLLEQQRLTRPGATDADHLIVWADDVVTELDLEPPIDPALVASYLGIPRVETVDLDVAGCLVRDDAALTIKVRRSDARPRRRFTICHECSHTFFPGFRREPQYRCDPGHLVTPTNRPLEQLCDLGASELLLPRQHFAQDLADMAFGLQGVIELANRYEASLEATARRAVMLATRPTMLVVLEEINKPRDSIGAPPRLRVRWSCASGAFPFVRRYKSVAAHSPFGRALHGEIVNEITDIDEICTERLQDARISARLCPYGPNRRRRVLALIRPSTP
jgi:hypothetical protein